MERQESTHHFLHVGKESKYAKYTENSGKGEAKQRTPRVLTVLSDRKQHIDSFKQRIKLKTRITTLVYISILPASSLTSLIPWFSLSTLLFHVFNALYMEFLCHLKVHNSCLQSAITFFQVLGKVHELGYWRPWSRSYPMPTS